MNENENWVKATILYHLRNKNVIGAKHTHYDTLKRGFPKHLGKEIEKIAKQLIKEDILVTKPTNYGLQVSLNKDKLVEIEGIIRQFLGREF